MRLQCDESDGAYLALEVKEEEGRSHGVKRALSVGRRLLFCGGVMLVDLAGSSDFLWRMRGQKLIGVVIAIELRQRAQPTSMLLVPLPHTLDSRRTGHPSRIIRGSRDHKTSLALAKSSFPFLQRSLLDSSCRHLVQLHVMCESVL
jgi:hypothetical protein